MKSFSLKTVEKFTELNLSEILLLRHMLLLQQKSESKFVLLDIRDREKSGLGKSSWYNGITKLADLGLIEKTNVSTRYKLSEGLFSTTEEENEFTTG